MPKCLTTITSDPTEHQIRFIRGQRVILDSDLARLYDVSTKAFNQAVRRNIERFPSDFMFQLSAQEASFIRSQFVTLKPGRGHHSKYAPMAFTEHGVAMLSSVLRSRRAIQVNIMIIRTFVRLREMIAGNKDLAARVQKLEHGHRQTGSIIEVLVDEIDSVARDVKEMKAIPPTPKRRIGFRLGNDD